MSRNRFARRGPKGPEGPAIGLWLGHPGFLTLGDMTGTRLHDGLRRLAHNTAGIMLVLTTSALLAGLILYAAGASGAGDGAWLAAGLLGAGYALWAVVETLRRGQAGVDVIALLAVAGAIAVRELLAAAVIAVMLASGRALEEWAAGRAHRDLRELLARAPRIARRAGRSRRRRRRRCQARSHRRSSA